MNSIRTAQLDDMSVLYPTDTDQLTLIACGDYDLISNTCLVRIVVTSTRQL